MDKLTDKERQIIPGIVEGRTAREIAIDLNIAESTVKLRLANIFDKLNASSRAELVALVSEKGI